MLLVGRNRLHAGRAREVAALILAQPKKLPQLIECLWDEDAGVANRAADALERATFRQPALALHGKTPYSDFWRKQTRTSCAGISPSLFPASSCPRLRRSAPLPHSEPILKTEAPSSRPPPCTASPTSHVTTRLCSLKSSTCSAYSRRSGTPAMRARGRILLKKLEATRKRTLPAAISTL